MLIIIIRIHQLLFGLLVFFFNFGGEIAANWVKKQNGNQADKSRSDNTKYCNLALPIFSA